MKNKLIVALLLSTLLLSGCNKEQNAARVLEVTESALDAEQTVEVKRGTVESYLLLEGRVSPKVHQIEFEELGKFGEYQVNIGEEVKAGQILATLNDTELQEQLETLTTQITNEKADYEYQRAYYEKTIAAYEMEMEGYYQKLEDKENPPEGEAYTLICQELGKRDVAKRRVELQKTQLEESYQLEYAYLQSKVAEVRDKLAKTTITAPCDGTVIALEDMSEETEVKKGYYYAAIAEKDVYYARCEYLAYAYIKGMKSFCGIRNGKEYDLSYMPVDEKIYREMRNNNEKLYTDFEITAPDADIDYGDSMMIKIIANKKENVLTIPAIAIGSDESGKYVYKQTPEGKEKVYITLGITDKVTTEVEAGLEEGEVVYVQR